MKPKLVLAVVATCAAGAVAAATGAMSSSAGPGFVLSGHWVFNAALRQAVHVDGASGEVGERVRVEADPGSQVVQGDTAGYVVGGGDMTEFDKSTLEVVATTALPEGESPSAIEVAGGPYLVFRQLGTVIRLGLPKAVVQAGEPLGAAVATGDGTVYLHRPRSGAVCQVRRESDALSCPVTVPPGHRGALTVVADRPMFVDTSSDTVHAVGPEALEAGAPLGFDAPDSVRLAAHDVSGRIAVLDSAAHKMHLVDAVKPAQDAVEVSLPPGDYDEPASTGSHVALIDRATDTLFTYDSLGRRGSKPIPAETGEPRLTRGEDARLYVDGAQGKHVLVVDHDGAVAEVPTAEGEPSDRTQPTQPPQRPQDQALPPAPVVNPPVRQQPVPQRTTATPPARQTPPPAPATPPGAPAGVSATAGNRAATVTWGTAPDNGAPVSGYLVSWTAADGATGSVAAGGAQRSTTVPNLVNRVAHTFTVRAINSAGQGTSAAANPVTPYAPPSITLTRGAPVECRNEDDMPCNWMHVVMTDFAPNTSYRVIARRAQDGWSNDHEPNRLTNANGRAEFNGFYYYGVGHTVWIEAFTPEGVVTSNRIVWSSS
ncbi:hypothetical protein ADL03_07735 [Nocardia sp. NRRL S-836]|nr:hypothetical protein ADL03_07735 [Nocardia sp. NRRL S-836]